MRILFISIIIIVALIIIYFLYAYLTMIDEKHTAGQAYGFSIGDSVEKAYQDAKLVFDEKDVFILYPLDKNDHGPHKKFYFTNENFKILEARSSWIFYFDESYFDFIKLTFKDESLISIYRHRKKFELP